MDVMVGVRSHLAGLTAIMALVSTRIHTPILPAKCLYPAIQLTLVSDVAGHHLRGPDGLFTDRVQVDSWATTRDEAEALGRLCRQRLNGYQGTWTGTGSPAPTMRVRGIFYEAGSERFEDEIHGGICRHSADYRVKYTDSDEQMLTT